MTELHDLARYSGNGAIHARLSGSGPHYQDGDLGGRFEVPEVRGGKVGSGFSPNIELL